MDKKVAECAFRKADSGKKKSAEDRFAWEQATRDRRSGLLEKTREERV